MLTPLSLHSVIITKCRLHQPSGGGRGKEQIHSLERASEAILLFGACSNFATLPPRPPACARTDLGRRRWGREGGRMALASLSYDSIWQRSARRVRPPLVGRGWHHISHAESSLMKSSLMQKCGGRRRGNGDADEEGGKTDGRTKCGYISKRARVGTSTSCLNRLPLRRGGDNGRNLRWIVRVPRGFVRLGTRTVARRVAHTKSCCLRRVCISQRGSSAHLSVY